MGARKRKNILENNVRQEEEETMSTPFEVRTTDTAPEGARPILEQAEAALASGASMITYTDEIPPDG